MMQRITRSILAGLPLCGAILVGACSQQAAQQPAAPPPQPVMKAAPPTPIAEKKEELGQPSWDPQWDVIVEQALSPQMLSPAAAHSVRSYCPRFGVMSDVDRRA